MALAMALSPLRAGKNRQKVNYFKTVKPPENNTIRKGTLRELLEIMYGFSFLHLKRNAEVPH